MKEKEVMISEPKPIMQYDPPRFIIGGRSVKYLYQKKERQKQ